MSTYYLDQTHRDSVRSIKAIRNWTARAHQRVATWEPRAMPATRVNR